VVGKCGKKSAAEKSRQQIRGSIIVATKPRHKTLQEEKGLVVELILGRSTEV
jgi:hypothetical protein